MINNALVFGDSFMDNDQFVMPSRCFESLEEWMDAYLSGEAGTDRVLLRATPTCTDDDQYITNYTVEVIDEY